MISTQSTYTEQQTACREFVLTSNAVWSRLSCIPPSEISGELGEFYMTYGILQQSEIPAPLMANVNRAYNRVLNKVTRL